MKIKIKTLLILDGKLTHYPADVYKLNHLYFTVNAVAVAADTLTATMNRQPVSWSIIKLTLPVKSCHIGNYRGINDKWQDAPGRPPGESTLPLPLQTTSSEEPGETNPFLGMIWG